MFFSRRLARCAAIVILGLLLATPAFAQPALWLVKNAHTTVYLFGTVHLLPNDTHWRYPALEKALAGSDSLTIEPMTMRRTCRHWCCSTGSIRVTRCRKNSAAPKMPR